MNDHAPQVIERHCDVAVVGGSAAGLAAALQLGRQRRSVIVVDAGEPRNAPAAHMHGYLSREGLAPSELIAMGRAEVRSYGGEVLSGRVGAVTRTDGDHFRVELDSGRSIIARRVLAATGLVAADASATGGWETIRQEDGIVVARVSMSPLFIAQFLDTLQAQWDHYAGVSGEVHSGQFEDPQGEGGSD